MELLTLIVNLVIGTGIVGALLFYSSKKRTAAAEAHGAELSNSDKLIAQYEKYLDTLRAEQTDLKTELSEARSEAREARSEAAKERDKVVGLFKELGTAQIDKQKAIHALELSEYDKCLVAVCRRRDPPRKPITEPEPTPTEQ